MSPKKLLLLLMLPICLPVAAQTNARESRRPPATGVYRVMEVLDTVHRLFKKNDVLEVSMQHGLRHYRNNQLINTYKIIPDTIHITKTAPCLRPPCPVFKHVLPLFYLEHVNRYIVFDDLSSRSYLEAYTPADNPENDDKKVKSWALWYELKKIRRK